MERNKLIALGLLIVATIAVVWATRGAGEEDHSNDPAYATVWRCAKCDATFELLPRDRAEALKLENAPPILCNMCREQAAYQVIGCPVCGTLYFGPEVPGASGFCPVCHPKKTPPEPPPDIPEEEKRPITNRN
ncbi:MAG TPA: hypothetical protein P5081_12010 [Phycisphaerae bacterium]|nr:hypothetical protein [Phycisphaerae bacterium]HRW53603.1 hypothetical protein [Phycisphaerae bacterium]